MVRAPTRLAALLHVGLLATSGLAWVEADADNQATVFLRAGDDSGEALVTAALRGFSREAEVRIVPAPADRVLWVADVPETAPADGTTLTELTVEISPELRGAESEAGEGGGVASRATR